jgi:hypothetical protein
MHLIARASTQLCRRCRSSPAPSCQPLLLLIPRIIRSSDRLMHSLCFSCPVGSPMNKHLNKCRLW